MEFNQVKFEQEVEKGDSLVLVDFYAPWCGPCKILGPVIEELTEDNKDKNVIIGKVNVDENQSLAQKYNVMGVPTIILFKKGEVVEQISGIQSKEVLQELIDKNKLT